MSSVTAPAPVPTFEELKDEFAFLGNWEDQCEYLIDLGLDLPRLPDAAKTETTKVRGCQSNVWMIVDEQPSEGGGRLRVSAESDAMLVNGLIAALLSVFDGRTPREALDVDVPAAFAALGLDKHLSTARKSGLAGMVKRIRREAARLAGERLADEEEEEAASGGR